MSDYVRYIDKTRDYYRAAGYKHDYAWESNDACAIAPVVPELSGAKIGLVTTASMVRLGEDGVDLETPRFMGSNKLEVFPVPANWPVDRLRSTSEDHDRFQTDMADVGAYFPKDLLAAMADEGVIGSVADVSWRILPNYSKRKVTNVDAPEVLRQMRDAGVDAAVITPV